MKIVDVITKDIRFPTSKEDTGTDAVHVDCDYSATYVTILTDNKSISGIGLHSGVDVNMKLYPAAVSYTHLTLPTNREV